jgi:single-strand DNA-binding protein
MSFNRITIVGNLGRDPELRYTPQGTAVCNLNVATTEKKRGKDGEYQQVTSWFVATLWSKMAEAAAKYLTKGSAVYLVGGLTAEEWTDKEGNNRTTLKVNATDMQFISGGNVSDRNDEVEEEVEEEVEAPAPKAKKAVAAKKAKAAPVDDDLPF